MHVFTTNKDMLEYLEPFRKAGSTIGFVPTMGAIHTGHQALIKRSGNESDVTIVSIFVNPTQFNDPKDLIKYPRPLAQDIHKISGAGADVLYLPRDEEVYPPDFVPVVFDPGHLQQVMEGPFRPGHFEGVITVVHRLLDVVKPSRLYMGLKDYQQQTIIRHMIKKVQMPVELVPCTIVREEDGLAFSSRNVRIDPALRSIAPSIYQTLLEARKMLETKEADDVRTWGSEILNDLGFRTEYFELCDGISLEPVIQKKEHDLIVGCVAAWLGDVRLIDNLVLKGHPLNA